MTAKGYTTPNAKFLIEQRLVGFAVNDGKWIVSQLKEVYWTPWGTLKERRPGRFLGVFDTESAAQRAADEAETMPETHTTVY